MYVLYIMLYRAVCTNDDVQRLRFLTPISLFRDRDFLRKKKIKKTVPDRDTPAASVRRRQRRVSQ